MVLCSKMLKNYSRFRFLKNLGNYPQISNHDYEGIFEFRVASSHNKIHLIRSILFTSGIME